MHFQFKLRNSKCCSVSILTTNQATSKSSGQTAPRRRLIWDFAVGTYHIIEKSGISGVFIANGLSRWMFPECAGIAPTPSWWRHGCSRRRPGLPRYLTAFPVMPRSHIHGSPRRFLYGSNPTDDPGNDNIRSPIRMHNASTTTYDYRCNTVIYD